MVALTALTAAAVLALLVVTFLVGLLPGTHARSPRDLGVRYSEADLRSARAKLSLSPGSAGLDTVLTDAEATALVNAESLFEDAGLRQVQVRFTGGDVFQLSAMARIGGRDVPIYAEGLGAVRSGQLDPARVDRLQVAALPVPSLLRDRLQSTLREQIERRLAESDGFALETVEARDGEVRVRALTTEPS